MKRVFNKIDKPLLLITILCLVFGLLMVGSASSLKAYMAKMDSFYYFKKQLLFIFAGFVASLVIIKLPIKSYKRLIYLAILGVAGALIYVLINDKIMNGVKGWLFIGPFGIQPSEFAKTVIILYLALAGERLVKIKDLSIIQKFSPFMVAIVMITLVLIQPDSGTAVIITGIVATIFLLLPLGKKFKLVVSVCAIIFTLCAVILMLVTGKGPLNDQKSRFNYTNPCSRYRDKTGYQVCNGYIAINSGGLKGSGVGNSKQKYLYLPEAHTDFIFAIIIEETGFISGAIIMVLYFLLLWRIIRIGRRSYNTQGTIISYGTAVYITLHIMINLVGVLGILPLTGVPLPFYSYGGSFLINMLICLALVQRVSVENKIFEQKHLVS